MNFGVEIRNRVTGRAVTLIGKQAVADFLAGVNASEWEGYKCLGELPPATQITTVPAPILDLSVDPILPSLTEALDAFHDGAETDPPKGADSIVLFEPVDNSDTPLVGAADPFADANPHAASVVGIVGDLSLSVGDSGAGDSYLPADTAGEKA